MAPETVRVSSCCCGEQASELGLQLGRKDMHSFHGSSLSRNRILRMRTEGDKGCVLQAVKYPAWKSHEARTDLTLRIDYVGQNGTTCPKLSFIETRLQVSTVQVLKAITSERRSFLELHSPIH
jgi:hypothetical protein